MVKPDASKDYYSDLGLHATADAAAINKAYKKLGMVNLMENLVAHRRDHS